MRCHYLLALCLLLLPRLLLLLQNERLFSRLREQEERTQLLTSFVLQQQSFISHLLRQQLPAALRQLELQRQHQETQQAFAVAAAVAETGDNFAADAVEKQQLLPLLQQLAFVPKSWWASFVRGTDYPCVSLLLPQHLRPPRDSANSNSYLHSATDKSGKAGVATGPPPQQHQQEQQQHGDTQLELDDSDAVPQQHHVHQQQQHKKSPKRGSTAWTAAVCPEVLEEAGVVDYSSILCPHYIRRMLALLCCCLLLFTRALLLMLMLPMSFPFCCLLAALRSSGLTAVTEGSSLCCY